ncbi:aldo/keto reductase [Bradyrhizobium elkanii]|uniref:aldo/keto reductase n=1 Tax=Bradyrhizobium elkanii TaxID=29448 RepID=UPI003518411C
MFPLERRTLGSTKVSVTSAGLGTVPLSGFNVGVSYSEFEAVIKAAFDLGVRYFDCAPMYGLGKVRAFPRPRSPRPRHPRSDCREHEVRPGTQAS